MQSSLRSLFFAAIVFSFSALAVDLPDLCYDTDSGVQYCTGQQMGKVQVLLYNAGWCPGCNTELSEIGPSVKEFANASVVFASLSGAGNSQGSKPDMNFLKGLRKKHNLPAEMIVGGKHRDFGAAFGTTGYIPFAVIIDKKGTVAKTGNLEVSEILAEVRMLLAQ